MIEIHPDDIFLVSYPKSGNTWLRFLIGNYLTNNQCDFTNSHLIVPDIHYNPEQINFLQKPRFIKSHLPFTEDYKRVIYIARDGRDVAVSYYFYALKFHLIDDETTFSDFVLNIIDQNLIDAFTPWSNHIFSWLDQKPDHFLFVKYEDMKANPVQELRRILEFSELPIDQERLLQAVEVSSFKNMQKLEISQSDLFKKFKDSNTNIRFVREGTIGGWDKFFSSELLAHFIETHGLALERLGYLSSRVTDGLQVRFHQLEQLKKQSDSLEAGLFEKQIECQELNTKLENICAQYQILQTEFNRIKDQFEQAQVHIQQSKIQVNQQQMQIDQQQMQQVQIQDQLAKAQARSQQLQTKLSQVRERSQKRQQNLKTQLTEAQNTLKAMESSKFWKLRTLWLRLKTRIGLRG